MSNKKQQRRTNGEGSIFQRKDGRWVGQYEVNTLAGPKRKCVCARSKSEVIKRRKEAIAKAGTRIFTEEDKITVGEYLDYWLENSVRGTVGHRTLDNYRCQIRNHLRGGLGHFKLQELQARHVQELYRAKREESGLSPASIRSMNAPLSAALNAAKREGIVSRNVAEDVRLPRADKREMAFLTRKQANELLQAAADTRLEALYVLAVATGMRLGELLGLKWSNVDLDSGWLEVTHQLQRDREARKLVLGPTKNHKNRGIFLLNRATKALQDHSERQIKEKRDAGVLYQDEGFVFATTRGSPLDESNISQRDFKRLLQKAGLPNIRFHDLRHTCATMRINEGMDPFKLQKMLGHESILMTLDRYSHLLPETQEAVARSMDHLLEPDETG